MALGWLKDIADIGSSIAGVVGLFSGKDEPEGLDEYRALVQQQQQLARDIANPPAAQVAAEETTLRRDFAEALRMAMAADRRERARDRGGLFYDRERQDETVARVAAGYYDQVKQKARDNVRAHLAQAAELNNFALTGAGNLVNVNSALDDQNAAMTFGGFEALFEGMRQLGSSKREPFSDLWEGIGGLLDGSSSSAVAARTNYPLVAGSTGRVAGPV